MAQERDATGAGSVLLAFIAGAAAGAAIALLFAPAKGEDTRAAVNRRARESRDRMVEALKQGRGILDRQRERAVSAFDRARQQAREREREQDA